MKVKRVIFKQNVNADLKAEFYEDNGNLHILVSKKGATPFYEEAGVIETEIIGESKPKMRTEYERVNESIFDLKADFNSLALLINVGSNSNPEYKIPESVSELCFHLDRANVYRKVEKEITWQDEFLPYADICGESIQFHSDLTLEQAITLCHNVASITDKPE